ncbi:DNA-directed RNA polymerase subunit delta [Staphylococcus schleiferi]|uniref:Probable DNA-directed RNA polymerase subunit delta n=1 Tax=Staphylococcus coagulans TaxID=74706 RepID=A0A9X0TLN4_9STAP|nr:DNA-directed RNA polymerase subunit delta [Staphylococcus coagulans]AKS66579.1 DNA-directed RNA polymerase subunit delta [Staphylococcus schleiferi]AKS68695.1 DNA-directed RNA polymerase subunit delta [Staphylococcus schleiferi]AKS70917.1 DNA-directed RNA polymerase subunit delta [Staphylococcus schleiferi]AKS73090.1 DNA-directed RNA polymerase subunit delta [Staphylococcus schleiferi]MBA8765095.1 DNA-directed RNA polymerase subunit delta [Staphylococcus coagulans]
MKLQDYTQEMVDEKSFIDMAYTFLSEQNQTMNLYDIIDEFKRIGHYEDDQIEDRIVQFYTDLNTDGRFLSVGDNIWGLRDWYSVDDIEEKIAPTIQKFDILDEDDEEDKNLTLLGEDDPEGDINIPNHTDDQEGLADPEDERVEDEIEDSDLVVEDDEDEIDETYDDEDEEEEDEEEF